MLRRLVRTICVASRRSPQCLTVCLAQQSQQRCGVRAFSATAARRSSFKYRHTRTTSEDSVNPLTTPTTIDAGTLHVVSVPIGNLKDFSIRALDVLRQVDYIVTTDRPATKTLLDLVHINAQGRLIHYSRTNRAATAEKIVEMLLGGRSMALVCTSGTPGIGDVGGDLVHAVQAGGVRVSAVPGPCALSCALAVAGVFSSRLESPTPRNTFGNAGNRGAGNAEEPVEFMEALRGLRDGSFFFGNMLPSATGARLRVLRSTVGLADHPCVFYEVPRRLLLVLQDIAAVLPKRRVIVAHELTKLNESLHADTAERLLAFYSRQEAHMLLKKGQLVLIIDSPGPGEAHERLQREAEKRRRLRRDLSEIMANDSQPTVQEKTTMKTTVTTTTNMTKGKNRRRLLIKKRRERIIAKIEREQERIRMAMQINRNDASQV